MFDNEPFDLDQMLADLETDLQGTKLADDDVPGRLRLAVLHVVGVSCNEPERAFEAMEAQERCLELLKQHRPNADKAARESVEKMLKEMIAEKQALQPAT